MSKITINSSGDGWQERLCENCEVKLLKDCTEISYKTNGDNCTLCIQPDGVYMRRTGGINLSMAFYLNAPSKCVIGLGEDVGETEFKTSEIKITNGVKGISLKLKYLLDGENETVLTATIIF